jgi:hypothetical protein
MASPLRALSQRQHRRNQEGLPALAKERPRPEAVV